MRAASGEFKDDYDDDEDDAHDRLLCEREAEILEFRDAMCRKFDCGWW